MLPCAFPSLSSSICSISFVSKGSWCFCNTAKGNTRDSLLRCYSFYIHVCLTGCLHVSLHHLMNVAYTFAAGGLWLVSRPLLLPSGRAQRCQADPHTSSCNSSKPSLFVCPSQLPADHADAGQPRPADQAADKRALRADAGPCLNWHASVRSVLPCPLLSLPPCYPCPSPHAQLFP